MKIILTGGGTGGHVIPNISLLPYLRKHFTSIVYIGTNSIEKQIVSGESDVKFYEIDQVKLDKKHKLKNVFLPFKLAKAVTQVKKILKKETPDVVFSKGGYVSLPVCIGAFLSKIPIVSHESDLSLGRANKIIYKLSTNLCTTFKKTGEGLKKAVYTGAPIRESLKHGDKTKGLQITNFTSPLPCVMFVGGSTGSMAINNLVFDNIKTLTQKYNVIHLVGKGKGKPIKCQNYYQAEYCSTIEHLFKLCDIVVSRAGSNAIYELLMLNKKMLLIPLPKSKSSRGDQVENAKYFKEHYNAYVLQQEKLNINSLLTALDHLSHANVVESSVQFNGSKNIVDVILNAVKRN